MDKLQKFQELVTIANREAFKFSGLRATCVLTSFALHDALQRLGFNSRLLRIQATVTPDDYRKLGGTILGGFGPCGFRRPAAPPGIWSGHLAVVVDDEWLLDPTLDQANKKEWPRSMRIGPLAVWLPQNFWIDGKIRVQGSGCSVRYRLHPRQNGFANAGDARPSHWRPLASQILLAIERRVKRMRAAERTGGHAAAP